MTIQTVPRFKVHVDSTLNGWEIQDRLTGSTEIIGPNADINERLRLLVVWCWNHRVNTLGMSRAGYGNMVYQTLSEWGALTLHEER